MGRYCLHYHHAALQCVKWVRWLHLHDLWASGGQGRGGADRSKSNGRPLGARSGNRSLPVQLLRQAHLDYGRHPEEISKHRTIYFSSEITSAKIIISHAQLASCWIL